MKKFFIKTAEYIFYLFIFLLPWQTRWIWQENFLVGKYWEYGSFSLYGIDIILMVILLLAMFVGIKQKDSANKSVWILVISFLAISMLSIFLSLNKELAWYSFGRLVLGVSVLWIALRIKFSYIKLAISLVAAGVIQSLLGLYQFFFQQTFATKWLGMAEHLPEVPGTFVVGTEMGRFLRAYGSLPHPNMLAGFLVICLLVVIGLYLVLYDNREKKGFIWKLILITFSFCVIFLGFLVTFSRSAWLALGISLIVLFLINVFKKKQVHARLVGKVLLASFLLVAVTIILVPELFQTRILSQERLEVKSLDERQEYFSEATQLVKRFWHRGVGIGNYTEAIKSKIDPNKEIWEYQPAHNIFILIAAEISIFGALVFLLLIFELIKSAIFTIAVPASLFGLAKKELEIWLYIFTTGFLSLLVIGLFDHYLWTLPFGIILFWLVLGVWARINNRLSSVDKLLK